MRVGFTGTKNGMTAVQKTVVADLLRELVSTEVRHGDCVGADADFHELARAAGVSVIIHPPANDKKRAWCSGDELLPTKPYLDRNHDIVDAAVILIATPREQTGGDRRPYSGTWATVRYARKRGKPVIIVRPDGSRQEERLPAAATV